MRTHGVLSIPRNRACQGWSDHSCQARIKLPVPLRLRQNVVFARRPNVERGSRKMLIIRLASSPPTITIANGRASRCRWCDMPRAAAQRGHKHGHHDGRRRSTAPSMAASQWIARP